MAANLADFTEEQLNTAYRVIDQSCVQLCDADGYTLEYNDLCLWRVQILNALNEVKARTTTNSN